MSRHACKHRSTTQCKPGAHSRRGKRRHTVVVEKGGCHRTPKVGSWRFCDIPSAMPIARSRAAETIQAGERVPNGVDNLVQDPVLPFASLSYSCTSGASHRGRRRNNDRRMCNPAIPWPNCRANARYMSARLAESHVNIFIGTMLLERMSAVNRHEWAAKKLLLYCSRVCVCVCVVRGLSQGMLHSQLSTVL
ncbi:hypothetical protein BCV70DRAFT_51415 [Testicularia cyperi]|uniref:Uncharacterized protein n=1 Tax=Testicularia cyperi TaxID=1882483 RepID=A0A317XVF6_9BASI|nr:hypothetical protein BCV70DRAFT_51415 [Testicularia cyperi]